MGGLVCAECPIDQVYQFSRMYWKSTNQQILPVTIKYPEMVAEIYPYFQHDKLPDFGKENLWFLKVKNEIPIPYLSSCLNKGFTLSLLDG